MNKNETAKGNEDLIKALHKEAEEIEKRAEPYREQRLSQEEKDDMYLKIMERLREMGELDEENESVQEVHEEKARTDGPVVVPLPPKPAKKPLWKRLTKCACIVAVAGAAIFATSLISEGNRMYWMEKWQSLFPGSKVSVADNDGDRVLSDLTEQEAKEEIELQSDLIFPEFFYLPQGTKYKDAFLAADKQSARLDYEYNEKIIYLSVIVNAENASESMVPQLVEQEVIELFTNEGIVPISLISDQTGSNGTIIYRGQWTYNNCRYELCGVVQKEELVKILEKMRYNV